MPLWRIWETIVSKTVTQLFLSSFSILPEMVSINYSRRPHLSLCCQP